MRQPRGWALFVTLLVACGGAARTTPTTPSAAAPQGPGAACLAIADTPHPAQPSQPDKVTVKHLLVKWSGSKNPAGATRSREEACLRAMSARDALRGGTDFDAVVGTFSDEAGAASRGGSLGTIARKTMTPAFSDAAFELAPGEFSDVVETEFGFHVIMRTQ